MPIKTLAIVSLLLFGFLQLSGQEGFQEGLEGNYTLYGAVARPDGRIAILASEEFVLSGTLRLLPSYEPGLPQQEAIDIVPENGNSFFPSLPRMIWLDGHTLLAFTARVGQSYRGGVIYFDTMSGQAWDLPLNIKQNGHKAMAASASSGIFAFAESWQNEPGLALYRITLDGDVAYRSLMRFDLGGEELEAAPFDALLTGAGDELLVIGQAGSGSFLLRMDTAGSIAQSEYFERVQFERIVADGEGGYYVAGSTDLLGTDTGNQCDLFLAKLNPALSVSWSRAYSADQFDFERVAISPLPDGGLALAYSTRGAFPTILAQLDAEGEVRWQKGYALYEPLIDVFPDGSLLLAARFHFDEAGERYLKTIVAKTDADGNIADCPSYPACLASADLSFPAPAPLVPSTVINVSPRSTTGLSPSNVLLAAAPFCDVPPSPAPSFSLPDTLCQGQSAAPEGLAGQNGNGRLWELAAPGWDSVWLDSPPEAFTFDKPGAYTVRQTVWTLGCAQSYERNVQVLDSLVVSAYAEVSDDCALPPLRLDLAAGRELAAVNWQPPLEDGSVTANGMYTVTATDGYCSASDTLTVSSLLEGIDLDSVLLLPPDTVICQAALPFRLAPQSRYAGTFALGQVDGERFDLPEAGDWMVTVDIEGCTFSALFRLEVEACAPSIFVPSAFSPNGDGINDNLRAYGRHHRVLRTEIYHRWGGMAWSADGDSAWDGSANGQSVPAGLYAYRIWYEDLRTGERGWLSGEVSLMR